MFKKLKKEKKKCPDGEKQGNRETTIDWRGSKKHVD